MKGADQKLLDMKKDLMTAEHMRDVYDLMQHYKKEPVTKPEMLKHDIKVKVHIKFELLHEKSINISFLYRFLTRSNTNLFSHRRTLEACRETTIRKAKKKKKRKKKRKKKSANQL